MTPEAELDRLFQLWSALEREQWRAEPDESPLERILTPAWESTCPRVRRAWADLTRPRNLYALDLWGRQHMNPFATKATAMALAECRRRIRFLKSLGA